MKRNLRMLDEVRIAKPCPANWNEMKGDDAARHCALCRKNVYNISQMTREQAVRLIQETEGGVCVRLYRRADGTVLTSDCPKGLASVRRKVTRRLALVASCVLTALGCGALGAKIQDGETAKSGALTGKARMETPVTPVQGPLPLDQLELGDLIMGFVEPKSVLGKHGKIYTGQPDERKPVSKKKV